MASADLTNNFLLFFTQHPLTFIPLGPQEKAVPPGWPDKWILECHWDKGAEPGMDGLTQEILFGDSVRWGS